MCRFGELEVRRPSVPAEHAFEVGGQHGDGVVEATSFADGVHGDAGSREGPQPRRRRSDPPAVSSGEITAWAANSALSAW